MVVPALVFVALNYGTGTLRGWAIPTATDIAFALAALAIVGTHLPAAQRTFLLTLAVVDDLLAVTVIGVFYTSELDFRALLMAVVPLTLFAVGVRHGVRDWWILLPLALLTWGFVHASGVHATIAGVVLGFTVPVATDTKGGFADELERVLRPISAGVAAPLFAFFAAGVAFGGWAGLIGALRDSVTVGVVLGLVGGKTLGILGSTVLLARFTRAELGSGMTWWDVLGLSVLAGIGFTVSLLISELAFESGTIHREHAKVGVLAGSVLAAALAATVLSARNCSYRRLLEVETVDVDRDGVPDVFEDGKGK